jgi:porin
MRSLLATVRPIMLSLVRHRPAFPSSVRCKLSLTFFLMLLGHTVWAESPSTVTGDWGGVRTELFDHGINLTTVYTSELANNPLGGDEEKTAYADEWAFGAGFDLQRLLGWNGGHIQITITDRNGHDLDQTANLHTLEPVQEIYGRGQTWRLSEFWFQQTWFDDRLLWKVGRVAAGETFGSFSCNFQNLTFCGSQPGSVRGDYWYNYPVSQWGSRLEFAVHKEMKLSLGVYQVNPTYIDDSWAAHNGLLPTEPSGTTGALFPLELDWTPKLLELPDSFKFGIWYDSSNANDVFLDINRQPIVLTGESPLRRHGRDGAYISFEQQISGVASKSGATLFLNITQADRDTSPSTDRQIAFGVQYRGPFASRPSDVLGFALGSTHVNSRVAAGERLVNEVNGSNVPVQSSEYTAEAFYGWTPWPFVTLRPNLQYVVHPGGSSAYANAIVVGLKMTVKF